ncbi:MAG: phage tail tape measure protein [Clostridiales bacterium]|nr:phage tail tape measure protein [Clostridiales bacterium]
MQAAGEKIQAVGEKIKGVGDKLQTIGRGLTAKVTTPIVAGFAAAVKTTGDFDAAMSKVQAVSGATASDMVILRDKAKEMGETTKFSASESAEALNYMAMAGWKTDQMLGGLEGIMNLAAASGEELGTTSDIVTDALTAFGYKAEQAGRFADILAAASSNSNTNVAMLGESFKYAANPAGALGYSAEDVAVALGLMANAGVKADMAGTSLRNMFQRMAKPTKESAQAMERLGLELYDGEGEMFTFREIMEQLRSGFVNIKMPLDEYDAQVEALDNDLAAGTLTQKKYDAALEELNKQAFGAEGAEKARAAAMLGGSRAMSGLLAIANASAADYEKLTSAIDNSSQAFAKLADGSVVPLNEALASGQEIVEQYEGSAQAMAETMLNNLPGQITLLKSQLEALAISFGELLMPTVRKVVSAVQEFMDKLNAMDDAQREQIIKIAAVVAAIGPALLVVGKVVSAIVTIVSAGGQLISFIGGVITKLGGLQAIMTVITGPIGIVIAAIGALTAAFVYFYNTNEEFRNKVNEVFGQVKEFIGAFIEQVKAWFQEFLAFCQPIFEQFQVLGTALGEFFQALIPVIMAVITQITAAVSAFVAQHQAEIGFILTFIKEEVTAAFDIVRTYIKTVLDVVTNVVRAFTSVLKGDWSGALNYLKAATDSAKNGIVSIFKRLVEMVRNIFSDLIGRMRQWGSDMIDNLVQGIKDKISAVTGAISGIASTIASYLHFSEPDVGPLSNFHTYAPDMMRLFAQGIKENAGLITEAIGSSFDLRPYFTSMNNGINRLTNVASSSMEANAQQGPVVVSVSLEGDAQRLFRVLSEEAHRDWQITGQSRLMGY